MIVAITTILVALCTVIAVCAFMLLIEDVL